MSKKKPLKNVSTITFSFMILLTMEKLKIIMHA